MESLESIVKLSCSILLVYKKELDNSRVCEGKSNQDFQFATRLAMMLDRSCNTNLIDVSRYACNRSALM